MPIPFSDDNGTFADSDASDVNKIHLRIVSREQGEPEEGFEPTPSWVWAISVILLFAMGYYLGKYGGTFGTIAHEVEQPLISGSGEVKAEVKGDMVFAGVCQACHQADGKGVEGKYPPLAGSEWLMQDGFTPARIVLYGLEGEIRVKGNGFNNKMPQFQDKLSNEEIAAAISYARSSFGNKGNAVSPAEVDSMRKLYNGRGPWSAAALESLRKK
ncbi:MAG TPA: cytochrome c [Bacteroidota bacterium]|nr:cytochrome c [Bacteroidota bacterium]